VFGGYKNPEEIQASIFRRLLTEDPASRLQNCLLKEIRNLRVYVAANDALKRVQ
jgi:hypothetical protein